MSTTIYAVNKDYSEKPIKLMVKKHMLVGIKYLCKTIQEDHNKYPGSGSGWTEILEEHGKEQVRTKVIFTTHSKSEFRRVGEYYSDLWDIVKSKDWANRKKELGDGGEHSEESKEVMSAAQLKRFEDPEERDRVRQNTLKQFSDPKNVQKQRDAANEQWADPKKRQAKSEEVSKRFEDPEERKKMTDAADNRWSDPEERERQSERLRQPETKKVIANNMRVIHANRNAVKSVELIDVVRHDLVTRLMSQKPRQLSGGHCHPC